MGVKKRCALNADWIDGREGEEKILGCVDEDTYLSSIRMIPTSNPNPIPESLESVQSSMKRPMSFGIWDRSVPRPPSSKKFKFQIYRLDFKIFYTCTLYTVQVYWYNSSVIELDKSSIDYSVSLKCSNVLRLI